jgi:hypothetical protein
MSFILKPDFRGNCPPARQRQEIDRSPVARTSTLGAFSHDQQAAKAAYLTLKRSSRT